MLSGILGRKVGMTQLFNEDGSVTPVTVIQTGTHTVIQKKTEETDGYNSVQVGFEAISPKKINLPLKGHFKDNAPKRFLKEFQVENMEEVEVGQVIEPAIFEEGETVNVEGTSKGRGFAGVMKRHNFAGQPASHGHRGHRLTGSIGQCADPGRVFKGKKMPGRYGGDKVTTLNLTIKKVLPEENLILVSGAVPGSRNGLVTIKKSNR